MEIRKEIKEKDFEYLQQSLPKTKKCMNRVPIFSAMLFALISNSSIYAATEELAYFGGLQDVSEVRTGISNRYGFFYNINYICDFTYNNYYL